MTLEQLKVKALDNLKRCLGYVENGTETTVTIYQDDATRSYIVRVGNRQYWGESLFQALESAAVDQEE